MVVYIKRFIYLFIYYYLCNDVFGKIPSWTVRKTYFRLLGIRFGKNSVFHLRQYIMDARKLVVGSNTHINRGCLLDARGGIKIGDSVSISFNVSLMTGSHKVNSKKFEGIFEPIVIEDYVWIGVNAVILQGLTIGKGAVVATGSVVTKDVLPFTIVAGIPAKVIGVRNNDLNYKCADGYPFL